MFIHPGSNELNSQFAQLEKLLAEARIVFEQQKNILDKDDRIWLAIDSQLTQIKAYIDKKQIPTNDEKKQLNLSLLLAKNFNAGPESDAMLILFKLGDQFAGLGLKTFNKAEALNFYKQLKT